MEVGKFSKVSSDSSKIAYQFGVSVSAIKSTNGLSSDTILIGQELLLQLMRQSKSSHLNL